MSKDRIEFNILFRKPIYPLVVISADKFMAAYNIRELAICCIAALPVDEGGIIKAIDSRGEEFWYSIENCAIAPGFASKRWTKGSRKNKFTFSHPIFRPSSAAPQSQVSELVRLRNPRNSPAIPLILLNRRSQI